MHISKPKPYAFKFNIAIQQIDSIDFVSVFIPYNIKSSK